MKKLVDKLRLVAQKAAANKGAFSFFAILLREDAPDRWDLVAAAPWIDKDTMGSLQYLARCLQEHLDRDELLRISRIVPLETGNPFLNDMYRSVSTAPGYLGACDYSFDVPRVVSGIPIKQMHILVCRRPAVARGKRSGSTADSIKASSADR